jgi:Protein of unknown function (DUF3168)
MSGPVLALRRAIHARLVADAALTGLLGGPRVYEEAPRAARGVYALFGDVKAEDWSTGSDRGCEQRLDIVLWGNESASASLMLEAADRVCDLLHDASLTLGGHRLVNLRHLTCAVERDSKTSLPRMTLGFRATTEAL